MGGRCFLRAHVKLLPVSLGRVLCSQRPRPVQTNAFRAMSSDPSRTQQFAKPGFPELSSKTLVEEEDIPSYRAELFYPVRVGEVFASRYQVVTKLGYGTSSTAWLCRDLRFASTFKHDQVFHFTNYSNRENRYLTLKVCTRKDEGKPHEEEHEITVSKHLNNFPIEHHAGKDLVRKVVDSFEVTGPNGSHQCLLYMPLGMSYTDFLKKFPKKMFPKDLVQRSIQFLLVAIAYLYQCEVVHTGSLRSVSV